MEYILWINDIVVIHNDKEYDFLNEMYPDIKELYNLIWHLQHNSSANRIYRMNKINNIKEEIKVRLKCTMTIFILTKMKINFILLKEENPMKIYLMI